MPPDEQYHRRWFMNRTIQKRSKIDSPGLYPCQGGKPKTIQTSGNSPASDFGRRDLCQNSWPSQWTGNEPVDVQVPTATVPDLISWVQGVVRFLEDPRNHQIPLYQVAYIHIILYHHYPFKEGGVPKLQDTI